jgi:hypothetical protein
MNQFSSLFRQAAQAHLNPALDHFMGEPVSLRGMIARTNYPPSPDPARPAQDLVAIFSWESSLLDSGASDARPNHHMASGGQALGIVQRRPCFSIAAPLTRKIVRGDQIRRYVDGTLFEITAILPNGVNRVEIQCKELGIPDSKDAA